MRQATLASVGFERYGKTTRRAAFLAEMDQVVPWPMLCALIEPVYPKPGNGRPPIGLERMLRIYFLQMARSVAPSKSAPASDVMRPPSNEATTARLSTRVNSNSVGLHSVGTGNLLC